MFLLFYPQVSICMPPLKILRNVVDRMKNLSNFVVISANQSGEMTLKVETDVVTVATHFRDLENPTWGKCHTWGHVVESSFQSSDPMPSPYLYFALNQAVILLIYLSWWQWFSKAEQGQRPTGLCTSQDWHSTVCTVLIWPASQSPQGHL